MQLRGAYAHLRRRSNLAFAPFGMTSDQYVLLAVLAEQGEATQQDLVGRCYSDTATIGKMLSLLQAKGLVTRKPHPHDRRATKVQLSVSGRLVAQKMKRSSSSVRVELAGIFDQRERRLLLDLLHRVVKAMHPPRRKPASSKLRPKH
jgi:DNA-binding MarR family transcriptional regulator